MWVQFEKWHGCGNDFILLRSRPQQTQSLLASLRRQAGELCRRDGFGIGADGLILATEPAEGSGLQAHIINPDGSLADHCGNGLRCLAASEFCRSQDAEFLSLELHLGDQTCLSQWLGKTRQQTGGVLTLDMGAATLASGSWQAQVTEQLASLLPMPYRALAAVSYPCDIHNRHLIFLPEEPLKAPSEALTAIATALPAAWELNVHVAQPDTWGDREQGWAQRYLPGASFGELYSAYSYERGVGLTQACGSGACAIGACILAQGFTPRSDWLGIRMPGGLLAVQQSEPEDNVCLTGPAVFSFRGEYDL